MSRQIIRPDSILVRTSQLPAAELGPDDTVLLDAERGVYYGLEGSGACGLCTDCARAS